MWRRIETDPPENYQDCLVSDGKSWPVCAVAQVFDGVAWVYPREATVADGYSPEWWMPLPRLPQRSEERCETDFSRWRFLRWLWPRPRPTPDPGGGR